MATLDSPRTEGQDHEFSFSKADFDRVRRMIYSHAGISLHEGKHAMVYSRLSRRLRDTGRRSFSEYLDSLERSSGAAAEAEWQEFVNCLTTNLTSFFREEHHFQALADELKHFAGKPLRIWCCAASTGEEPYSIAITCHEALGSLNQLQLVCSDIDTNVLATARRGVYNEDARGLSPQRLRNYFMKGTGANAGRIRFKPDLARNIDFRVVNLMHPQWQLGEPFQMVFCRNVMIYFDGPTQRKVLERIHKVMQPRGLLFVGHSENFTESKDLFRLRGKTIYERV
ncbi:chemotaxis protein methyltransferase CheR [Inhella inkyongensis]|uniref:Chemotaxis protein methyltransferase n=1 Tax=Inhella inkyongensis TaxID=392593 RepID=A0A840S438_9BURK|nr:CheR family methyltransferase [Inhella inkyongensis]MBB5206037.1 chemotaxis protein methyltransferase CheR [Inhella inkyongensis]